MPAKHHSSAPPTPAQRPKQRPGPLPAAAPARPAAPPAAATAPAAPPVSDRRRAHPRPRRPPGRRAAGAGPPRPWPARRSRSRPPCSARGTTRSPPTSCCATRRAAPAPGPRCASWPPAPTAGAPSVTAGREPAAGRTPWRPGATRSPPGGTTRGSRSRPAWTPELVLEEGAAAVRAGRRRGAQGRRAAGACCWPPSARCATRAARRRPAGGGVDAGGGRGAGPPSAAGAGHRVASRCRCWWSGSGRCTAPGTSSSPAPRAPPQQPHGTFRTAARRLPAIAAMGFDVVYLPPIHPIGTTFRKGPNNTLVRRPRRRRRALGDRLPRGRPRRRPPRTGHPGGLRPLRAPGRATCGLEVALDFALQCSPDHPWVHKHPEWFHHRPDGTIAYAENPPKKYQDIYPIAFDADMDGPDHRDRCGCCGYWMDHGVRIFRVDNPHTKPVVFWERVIARHQPHRPRRDLPGRGVHPPRDDAHPRRRSASSSPTPTSPGATPSRN